MQGRDMGQQNERFFRAVRNKKQVYNIIGRSFYRRFGWRQLPHGIGLGASWNLLWTWAKPEMDISKLFAFQKINHFTTNKNLVKKDILKKNIQRVKSLGFKSNIEFNIIPQTFLLPKQYCKFVDRFLEDEIKDEPNLWILKPTGKSRGRGISMINRLDQVLYNEPMVIQKYINNPLLIGNKKFDLRVYVLLTSVKPLQAFIYNQGFARFSNQFYSLAKQDVQNNFIHLTNYAIQKQHQSTKNNNIAGSKMSFRMLDQQFKKVGKDWKLVWERVKIVILKSLVVCCNEMDNNPCSFELLGYDIMVDNKLNCWLIEVNASPSLQRDFILDDLIKQQLVDDILDLVDPPAFNHQRLLQVIGRRIKQQEGNKSTIFIQKSNLLNKQLNYIFNGKPFRAIGQTPKNLGGFLMIAPSPQMNKISKLISSYKVKQVISSYKIKQIK